MMLLALLAACNPIETGVYKPPEDTATTDTTDTYTYTHDTGDTDGDLDDDGFTPEEGDCDDADIHVSPARDEEQGDGKDNDCDGRTDEEWSGFTVGRIDGDGAGSLVLLDTIGRGTDLSIGTCTPYFLDNLQGGGWVISNGLTTVATVDTNGACADIADFSDTESGVVYGVAVGPDGTIYAVQPDTLVSVALDGTVTTLASWSSDDDMFAIGLAADPKTGQLGIFDYFGGFATYDATDGFVIHIPPGTDIGTLSGAHKDNGGWYVPAWNQATGEYAVYSYDDSGPSWVEEEVWTDEDWSPYMLAIDGDPDSGSFYVTTNANGVFPTVWRIVDGTGYAADFYQITTDYAGFFWGIATAYTYE